MFTCLIVFACVRITRLLNYFEKEKINQIQEQILLQNENNKKLADTAEIVIEHVENSKELNEKLSDIVNANNVSMKDISVAILDTAKTVQRQSEMTLDTKTYVESASDSVGKSTSSLESQNSLIDLTGKEFGKISSEIIVLKDQVNELNEAINNIVKSNERISDHVEELSATSEEVAATSKEGVAITDDAVAILKEYNAIVNKIYEVIENLK